MVNEQACRRRKKNLKRGFKREVYADVEFGKICVDDASKKIEAMLTKLIYRRKKFTERCWLKSSIVGYEDSDKIIK
ncbi:MAG: hypothetical protein B7Y39_10215 [Bdellovibrio sp. 28-41-41]|nr:MAG: hypothetical protein B7Y39_10215 [Bdellovibrio sp. 28-41-41]